MSNNALVCWSGGCDSTVVLANLLEQRTIKVRTISIIHNQVGANAEQKSARQTIKNELTKKYGEFESFEVNITSDGNAVRSLQGGLCQPIIWLPLSTLYLQENEDLYVGYISGDDVWHYKQDLLKLFNYSQIIQSKIGILQMPLEWQTKSDIIYKLKQHNLYEYGWYCEYPTYDKKQCGICHSCEVHNMYLTQYDKIWNNISASLEKEAVPLKIKKQKKVKIKKKVKVLNG